MTIFQEYKLLILCYITYFLLLCTSKKSSTFAAKNAMETDRFLEETFIEMLHVCNCKKLFLENMCEQLKDVATWEFLFKIPAGEWVRGGFLWSKSKEGFEYWKHIEDIWYLILLAYRTNIEGK